MAGIDFFFRRSDELIEQVVRFDAKALAPADPDEGSRLVFLAQVVAELGRAAGSQRHHAVGKVREMVGSFFMTQIAQGFLHGVLRFRLSYVDR